MSNCTNVRSSNNIQCNVAAAATDATQPAPEEVEVNIDPESLTCALAEGCLSDPYVKVLLGMVDRLCKEQKLVNMDYCPLINI